MVKLIFKHYKSERYSYAANASAKVSVGKTEDTVAFENDDCDTCTVNVCRRTIYSHPLCYINIINPFLYLWRFKVPFDPESAFGKALSAYQIQVYNAEDNACLVLMFNDTQGKTTLSCLDWANCAELKVKQITVDEKTKKRFTITNLVNTLLWTVAVIILMLLPDNDSSIGITGTVAVVGITVAHAVYIISRIFKHVKRTGSKEALR